MSGLLKRLQRTLNGRTESLNEPTRSIADELEGNASLLSRLQRSDTETLDFLSLEGATLTTTPVGPCYELVSRYRLTYEHGETPLSTAFEADCSHLESFVADPRLNNFAPDDALFLDIEATGLDHGAGTFAFLIGLGYREGNEFVVRQLFLPSMHDEQPMLHVLRELLSRFKYLISFNGKSYDLTVLQSRMVIQRLYSAVECNLKLQPHLDLLHLARNIYRHCFENTRLPTLERNLFNFIRLDDVPSALVPTMWFEYLRTQDANPIRLVAEHNLYDVLSMVSLTGILARHSRLESIAITNPALIALNVGRVWLRRKNLEMAIESLEAVDDSMLSSDAISEKYAGLYTAYNRRKDFASQGDALSRWCRKCPDDSEAWTAQAIYSERRAKNLVQARHAAERAYILNPSMERSKRIERLNRRLGLNA